MEEQQKVDFAAQKARQKKFFMKTKALMYVLVLVSAPLAVFVYVISAGTLIFITAMLLLMTLLGTITAIDARKHEAELDDFALYYGLNKLQTKSNETKKV